MIERAAILSTGDELTTGRIVDSNASWIADKLFEIGVDVVCVLTVGDWPERLAWAWRQALAQADVVISTGGIGPTADDLTSETVAGVLGVPLVEDAASADRIRRFFAASGRPMPENNLKQALLPAGAVVVPNALGTAPGYRVAHGERTVFVLPGVPREMKPMVEETVLPWLRAQRGGDVYLARTFQTFGVTESGLDELVAGVVDPAEGRVSFRASFPEVSVRVVAHGEPAVATARLAAAGDRLRAAIGPYCYGEGAVTMEETVGALLRTRGLTVATAESCTGGLVAHRLTNVPGSSAYVRGGANIINREEAFPSSYADYIPGVKGSGRAYTVFLNKMRADVFDWMISNAEKKGLEVDNPKFLDSLGEFVNSSTGRGKLPGKAEDAAVFLNSFLFSPRLLASRFNLLNPHYYWKLAPGVREEAVKSSVATLSGILGFLTLASQIPGASVNLDSRSANFAKVRIGNTRIDVAGGFLPLLVLYTRLVTGTMVSSSSGKKMNLTGNYGDTNQWEVMQRFLEGKMAPTPGLVRDLMKHQTYLGKPVTWKGELGNLLVPLNVQGVRDVYRTEHNIPAAVGAGALGSIGVGVNSYPNTKPKAKKSSSGSSGDWLSGGVGSTDWLSP